MKLIVRSSQRGRLIHGQPFVQEAPLKPYKLLFASIEFHERRKPKAKWGCCRHNHHRGGQRVLELTESQFLDAYNGRWNLYLCTTRVDPTGRCPPQHEFLFVPANQRKIDVKAGIKYEGWKLWGSCNACILRMDLEPLLQPFLQEKKQFGRVVSHVHISVMMDYAVDKEFEFTRNQQRDRWNQKHRVSHATSMPATKEESSCCSISSETVSVTTATTDDSHDNFSDMYSCHSGGTPPSSFDEGESDLQQRHHSSRRGRSPVRPPRHVQCTTTLTGDDDEPVVDPVQILMQVGAMKPETDDIRATTTTQHQPQSQFRQGVVEPPSNNKGDVAAQEAEKGNAAGSSYLAALKGAPSMVESNSRAHQPTNRLAWHGQSGPAEPQGCWKTQQDFPALGSLAESFHQMNVNVVDEVPPAA